MMEKKPPAKKITFHMYPHFEGWDIPQHNMKQCIIAYKLTVFVQLNKDGQLDNANGDRTNNGRHRFTKRVVTFSTNANSDYVTQRSETVTEYYTSGASTTDGSDFDEMSDITSGMSSARSEVTFSMDTNRSEDFSEDFSEEETWEDSILQHQAEAIPQMAGARLEDLEDVQVGAPLTVIDSLPTYWHFSEGYTFDHKQCLICLGDFRDGDELCLLPCSHRYHVPCIHEWLTRNSTCPACRKSILEP